MKRSALLALLTVPSLLSIGCRTEVRPLGETPRLETQAQPLIVHEWGTYTSLQASDGRTMDGLHHAEHLLPAFVHARDWFNPDQKGMEGALAEPVNQKLETPVLYFYGDADRVNVDVRFPEGIISEWYPDASAFLPPLDAVVNMAGGQMTWEVELVDSVTPPEVEPDGIWAPARHVAARGVKMQDQEERFIFYRGLGRFERPFRVTSKGDEITIASDERIPAAFLLHVDGPQGGLRTLGPIESETTVLLPAFQRDWVARAMSDVKAALVATGLYEDEAQAMVETWRRSYFMTPGTRVLYVAPRAWTDALLPIEISPAPDELVRTLVGRVEVLTESEEARVLDAVRTAYAGGAPIQSDRWGRFTEPRLRRAAELLADDRIGGYARALADTFAVLP